MTNDEIESLLSAYSERGDEWVMSNARDDVAMLGDEAQARLELDEDTAWVIFGALAVSYSEGVDGLPLDHDRIAATVAENCLVKWLIGRYRHVAEQFPQIPAVEACLKASKS